MELFQDFIIHSFLNQSIYLYVHFSSLYIFKTFLDTGEITVNAIELLICMCVCPGSGVLEGRNSGCMDTLWPVRSAVPVLGWNRLLRSASVLCATIALGI